MTDIEIKIEKAKQRVEYLEQQNRDKLAKEKAKQKKINDKYKFIIGDIVMKHFSHKLNFNSTQTKQEQEYLINQFEKRVIYLKSLIENKNKH